MVMLESTRFVRVSVCAEYCLKASFCKLGEPHEYQFDIVYLSDFLAYVYASIESLADNFYGFVNWFLFFAKFFTFLGMHNVYCRQACGRGACINPRIKRNRAMNDRVQDLLHSVQSTPDFGYVDFQSINDTNALGDNALHCVCSWGDLDAAKLLVENGIDLNQRGELGFTPLNVALVFGHHDLADFLLARGADPKALEAEPYFDRERQTRHVQCLTEHLRELEHQLDLGLCIAPTQCAAAGAIK